MLVTAHKHIRGQKCPLKTQRIYFLPNTRGLRRNFYKFIMDFLKSGYFTLSIFSCVKKQVFDILEAEIALEKRDYTNQRSAQNFSVN